MRLTYYPCHTLSMYGCRKPWPSETVQEPSSPSSLEIMPVARSTKRNWPQKPTGRLMAMSRNFLRTRRTGGLVGASSSRERFEKTLRLNRPQAMKSRVWHLWCATSTLTETLNGLMSLIVLCGLLPISCDGGLPSYKQAKQGAPYRQDEAQASLTKSCQKWMYHLSANHFS